jgi:PPOX class probable F420-dependent enzyme
VGDGLSDAGAAGLGALEPWARELLRDARVGRLGTAGGGGRPLVVPVCYTLLEGVEDVEAVHLVSAVDDKPKGSARLRRLRNLGENPLATLLVDVWDEDWTRLRWVMVEGEARVIEPGDGATRDLREAALLALEAKYPQYRALPLDRERAPLVLLRADRVRAWRFAGGSAAGKAGTAR